MTAEDIVGEIVYRVAREFLEGPWEEMESYVVRSPMWHNRYAHEYGLDQRKAAIAILGDM